MHTNVQKGGAKPPILFPSAPVFWWKTSAIYEQDLSGPRKIYVTLPELSFARTPDFSLRVRMNQQWLLKRRSAD